MMRALASAFLLALVPLAKAQTTYFSNSLTAPQIWLNFETGELRPSAPDGISYHPDGSIGTQVGFNSYGWALFDRLSDTTIRYWSGSMFLSVQNELPSRHFASATAVASPSTNLQGIGVFNPATSPYDGAYVNQGQSALIGVTTFDLTVSPRTYNGSALNQTNYWSTSDAFLGFKTAQLIPNDSGGFSTSQLYPGWIDFQMNTGANADQITIARFAYYTDSTNTSAFGTYIPVGYTGSAIPEPSTYAAIAGLLMLGVAILRRSRRYCNGSSASSARTVGSLHC